MRLPRKTLEKTDKTGPKLSEKGFDNYGKMNNLVIFMEGQSQTLLELNPFLERETTQLTVYRTL